MTREYTINLGTPGFVPSDHVVTTVRIEPIHGYDKVTIWNRGANAGILTLREGDGEELVARLFEGQIYTLKMP